MYTYITKALSAILLVFTSIAITFDSGIFIYSSLSNSLFFSIMTSLLALIAGIYAICNTGYRKACVCAYAVSLWGIYILLHSCYANGEYYRSLYLISGIIYLIALYSLIQMQIISITFIKNILLGIAVIQLIFMIGQSLNIIDSYSKYFPVSGTNENPNVNAIFILCCIPILIGKIKDSNRAWAYKVLLGCILLFLFILQCRTAYIGGIVILSVYFLSSKYIHRFRRKNNYIKKGLSLLLLCMVILFAGIYLYQIKKDSADGRLFIWKLSAEMIKENPLRGYGYGLFERNYNLKQADYFSNQTSTTAEHRNASFVSMAYNDYLEEAIEGGIIGFLCYLGFFIVLGRLAIKQKDIEALSIVSAVAVMALFNFIYAAITTWFLLLSYGGILLAASNNRFSLPITLKKVSAFTFCCIAILLLYHQCRVINAQIGLQKSISLIKKDQLEEAGSLLAQLLEQASTSEAFLTQYANSLARQKQYQEAIVVYQKATLYTSNPSLYYRMANCYTHLSQYDDALRTLNTIAAIIPTNLRSRYQRMCLQRHIHDMEGAWQTAWEIINISPKVSNKKAEQYKEQAQKLLEYYNK